MTDTTSELAAILLGQPLGDWVRVKRGAGLSWSHISRDLYIATSGRISRTGETLRVRYPDPSPDDADSTTRQTA
ncbi:hypothetical protein [Alloactinosynnema sp. L-07]|uniref:hypothetical protein n=1 Tax=Alloactinosynnema sp. L-07 TaxID=1653480 RepID=UPI00065EF5C1|nr:hypothetical protein [Alloactinosynnema sp. L-07]CRK59017.1 hypothetical protein [Alloactinosynnema sp. L-07]